MSDEAKELEQAMSLEDWKAHCGEAHNQYLEMCEWVDEAGQLLIKMCDVADHMPDDVAIFLEKIGAKRLADSTEPPQ